MLDAFEENVRFFALHWVRCIALIAPLPLFGSARQARVARIGLGVMLGTLLALVPGEHEFDDPGFSLLLVPLVAREMLLGLLLAFLALGTFAAMRIAGHLIGSEMGFNLANIQDPITGVNTQLMAHLFEAMGLVLFFIVDGHHTLFRALAFSFRSIPVGTFSLEPEMVPGLLAFTSGLFITGLQVAAPVFASMMIVGVSLAILSKVAPQLQVMMFAFPMKVLAGLIMLLVSLTTIVPAMTAAFVRLDRTLAAMLGS